MRHSYTPIFKDVLTSRVWALPDAHLRVWLWLQLQADPEGFICADVTGVAVGARVSGKDAREALEVLSLADADADPRDPDEGRLIARVPGGWCVLGVDERNEQVRRESKRARNNSYMRAYRARAANDSITESSPNVTQSAVPASRAPASDLESSLENPKSGAAADPDYLERAQTVPAVAAAAAAANVELIGFDAYERQAQSYGTTLVPPSVVYAIPATWQPSQSLRDDATMAGVSNLDERLAVLRSGPIGGVRGVFENAIEDYVRALFGKWRTWDETDRAKANKPRGQSYRDRPEDTLTTTQAASAFRPSADHENFCAKHNLDLTHAVKLYRQSPEHDKVGFAESERRFLARLKCWQVTGTFHPDGPLPKAKRAEREGAAA